VTIKKIEVERFSLREGVSLKVFFDDGGNKCLAYASMLDNVTEDVKNIITKITVYEKAQNKALDPDDFLDNFVSVIIENEEEMLEKMRNFLTRIRDDRSKLRGYGTHVGYIESLNKMQKKSIEFSSPRAGIDESQVRLKRIRDDY
jgi:hypothetical protein